jgi:hypothetical protein
MNRFPTHTVEDAPEGSRALLQGIAVASPTGRPLKRACPDGALTSGAGRVYRAAWGDR